MSKVTLKISMPHMPNFLRIQGGDMIDICDLEDEELEEFAEEYKQALIKHAEKRRLTP